MLSERSWSHSEPIDLARRKFRTGSDSILRDRARLSERHGTPNYGLDGYGRGTCRDDAKISMIAGRGFFEATQSILHAIETLVAGASCPSSISTLAWNTSKGAISGAPRSRKVQNSPHALPSLVVRLVLQAF